MKYGIMHRSLAPLMMASAPPGGFMGGGAGGGNGGAPDNSPASQTGDSNQGQQPNNSGQTDDLAAFWNDPSADNTGAPSNGGPAAPASQPTGTPPQQQPQQNAFATQLQQDIANLSFGNVIDDAVAAQLQEGNYEEFNKRNAAQQQQMVQATVGLTARILQEFGKVIKENIREQLNSSFTNRDDNGFLESNFPAAKDPIARPMIEGVWKQALKRTGGDRAKALPLAKRVLAAGMGAAAPDVDLSFAPRNPGDQPQGGEINWLENLNLRT